LLTGMNTVRNMFLEDTLAISRHNLKESGGGDDQIDSNSQVRVSNQYTSFYT